MKELIAPTTSASTDTKINIPHDGFVTVAADNLAGAEEVTFDLEMGGTWTAIVAATTPKLDASNNTIQLAGPATYRVNKDATAGACGVYTEGY